MYPRAGSNLVSTIPNTQTVVFVGECRLVDLADDAGPVNSYRVVGQEIIGHKPAMFVYCRRGLSRLAQIPPNLGHWHFIASVVDSRQDTHR